MKALAACLALAGALGCGHPAGPGGQAASGACPPATLGPVRVERIALWRDDAQGAYSIIHDDTCGWGLDGIQRLALPALERRGLRAGLGAMVRECEEQRLWPMLQAAQARGHEILDHSYTHPRVTPGNASHEIVEAKAVLDRHLRAPVRFYVFPFDHFTPETLAIVARAGHLGARAGNRDDNDGDENPPINPPEPGNDMAVEFDVWPRAYSAYARYRDLDLLNVHAWNAIERRGWAVRELHTVLGEDQQGLPAWFGPIRLSTYEKHLDFLVAARRRRQLWIDTPSTVLAYRHARQACRAAVAGTSIVFDASSPECRRFATPLSVIVGTDARLPGLAARQGARPVPVVKLGPGAFSVTADPTGGAVALRGCAREGMAMEALPPPDPRPVPAASVCDLATVTARAEQRSIDDLERPPPFEPALDATAPPSGLATWTWYPEAATAERREEGANVAARFSGEGLKEWSGLTLGFVGPSGEASCLDARVHRGVRFRLRGSVRSADELDGKAIFSLITAETRARRYGGDLAGTGGHFQRILPVSAEWRWFEIPWDGFAKPSWGDTVGLSQPALGKLLALDWGVSDRASSFELFIDAVEFY